MEHDGRYYEKENVYIYVYLGHFAVQQKLTEHHKSTIINFLNAYVKNLFVPWGKLPQISNFLSYIGFTGQVITLMLLNDK